jgi:glucose-6-phosphate isomerase
MIDLKSVSGLPVFLTDENKLKLDENLSGGDSSTRKLFDLESVLKSPVDVDGNRELYYMYRDVHKSKDEDAIRNHALRYDMTIILPGMVGEEYAKTLGHYHPDKEGQRLSYPEVYEVISGRAFYLIQKPQRTVDGFYFGTIEEAYLIEVKAGEKAIMPPDFGHITINIDSEPLVMSNWVCADFQSDYSEIKNFQGGCYYLTKGADGYQAIKNSKYTSVPELKVMIPKELEQFALKFSEPMYQTGMAGIDKLDYLVKPEDFKDQLRPTNVFAG